VGRSRRGVAARPTSAFDDASGFLDAVRTRAKAEGAVEADALVGLVRDEVVEILDDGADRRAAPRCRASRTCGCS
jgi:hypothetical protein